MEESTDWNHSAAGNFQLSFSCVFSGIWTSLENTDLKPRITTWGLPLWPLGKLSVEATVATTGGLQWPRGCCGTHVRCMTPHKECIRLFNCLAFRFFFFAADPTYTETLELRTGLLQPISAICTNAQMYRGRKRSSCLSTSPDRVEHLQWVKGIGQKVSFRATSCCSWCQHFYWTCLSCLHEGHSSTMPLHPTSNNPSISLALIIPYSCNFFLIHLFCSTCIYFLCKFLRPGTACIRHIVNVQQDYSVWFDLAQILEVKLIPATKEDKALSNLI